MVIVDLVPGTPAEMSQQVFAGDIIEQADGQNLMGKYISDVVSIISVPSPLPIELHADAFKWMCIKNTLVSDSIVVFHKRIPDLSLYQGGRHSGGTFVCLRLLRDSSARITVKILRQDKREIVPKPQASMRPQIVPRLRLDAAIAPCRPAPVEFGPPLPPRPQNYSASARGPPLPRC